MVLTQQPLQLGMDTDEPPLHALVIIDRTEPDPTSRQLRMVHAHINLTAAVHGEPPWLHLPQVYRACRLYTVYVGSSSLAHMLQ